MLSRTIELIRGDAWRMDCLEVVRALRLPDWYIAAGFLRGAIWDAVHATPSRTPLNDVDVVFHAGGNLDPAVESRIEADLRASRPDVNWEARNQARMHVRNGHAPYRDSEDAIAHWIETPTCVGVRLEPDGRLTIVAPYGIEQNWSLRVAPNPVVHYPAALFNDRVRKKRWLERWPRLLIEWARDP